MRTYQIARRIWPLSELALSNLVYDTRAELRVYRRGRNGDCTRRRKLRRRMAVAWHAMRLWKRCWCPPFRIEVRFGDRWAVLAECKSGDARGLDRDAAIALLRYYENRMSWPLRLVRD